MTNRRTMPQAQSDIARAARAAKAAGASGVELFPDGRIVIRLDTLPAIGLPAQPVDDLPPLVL